MPDPAASQDVLYVAVTGLTAAMGTLAAQLRAAWKQHHDRASDSKAKAQLSAALEQVHARLDEIEEQVRTHNGESDLNRERYTARLNAERVALETLRAEVEKCRAEGSEGRRAMSDLERRVTATLGEIDKQLAVMAVRTGAGGGSL
jgi:tetrahydromethanopterin S-methyltransferase subunit G